MIVRFRLQIAAACLASASVCAQTQTQASDQCDSIRQAILSAQGSPAIVKIPAGQYLCSSPLVIDRSDLRIEGAGVGKTSIKMADNTNCSAIIVGDLQTPPAKRVTGVEVSGLSIDGNKDHQKYECWGQEKCDDSQHPLSHIRNNGITIRGASNISVHDVEIENSRSGGLVTEKKSDHVDVNRVSVKHSFFDGFAACETTDSVFSNLDLSYNNASGISLDLGVNGNIFRNSTLRGNHDNGVFMRFSSRNRFEDLKIDGNENDGVFMAWSYTKESCISENVFNRVEIQDSKHYALKQEGAICTGNKLLNSSVHGNGVDTVTAEAPFEVNAMADVCNVVKGFSGTISTSSPDGPGKCNYRK